MKKQPYYSFFDSDEKTRNAIECFLHIKMNPLFKQFYRKVGSFLPSKPCKIRTFLFQLVQNYQSERKRATMNVRKPVDYGTMYRELTAILAQNLPQMDEIHAIGKVIHQRPEKGAAVAAAEFLQANFPDRTGFSPRNVRRMRDFYKTYENDQALLRLAMKIGWTLNVVIMEAELTRAERKWYLEQALCRGWSKVQLLKAIHSGADSAEHLEQFDSSEKQVDQVTVENPSFAADEVFCDMTSIVLPVRQPCITKTDVCIVVLVRIVKIGLAFDIIALCYGNQKRCDFTDEITHRQRFAYAYK